MTWEVKIARVAQIKVARGAEPRIQRWQRSRCRSLPANAFLAIVPNLQENSYSNIVAPPWEAVWKAPGAPRYYSSQRFSRV